MVWCSVNSVHHINEVKLRQAKLVLELVMISGMSTILVFYPGHSGPLSLAIPPWVGAMSTGDGFSHLWEETAVSEVMTLWRFIIQFINIKYMYIKIQVLPKPCDADLQFYGPEPGTI